MLILFPHVGGLQLVLRRAVMAGDPVARRRPVGAPGPPNNANAGETPGRKAFCVSAWVDGAVDGAAAWSRSPSPPPAHGTGPIAGTGRPGLAAAPSPGPIPGTAVAVQWSEGFVARGRSEREGTSGVCSWFCGGR